jgi:hypothetical protein
MQRTKDMAKKGNQQVAFHSGWKTKDGGDEKE